MTSLTRHSGSSLFRPRGLVKSRLLNVWIFNQAWRIMNRSHIVLQSAYSKKAAIRDGVADVSIEEYEEFPAEPRENHIFIKDGKLYKTRKIGG